MWFTLWNGLLSTAQNFKEKGIETIAISSNSEQSHPQDGPIEMKKLALEKNFAFPYLFDKTQEVAPPLSSGLHPRLLSF